MKSILSANVQICTVFVLTIQNPKFSNKIPCSSFSILDMANHFYSTFLKKIYPLIHSFSGKYISMKHYLAQNEKYMQLKIVAKNCYWPVEFLKWEIFEGVAIFCNNFLGRQHCQIISISSFIPSSKAIPKIEQNLL